MPDIAGFLREVSINAIPLILAISSISILLIPSILTPFPTLLPLLRVHLVLHLVRLHQQWQLQVLLFPLGLLSSTALLVLLLGP